MVGVVGFRVLRAVRAVFLPHDRARCLAFRSRYHPVRAGGRRGPGQVGTRRAAPQLDRDELTVEPVVEPLRHRPVAARPAGDAAAGLQRQVAPVMARIAAAPQAAAIHDDIQKRIQEWFDEEFMRNLYA